MTASAVALLAALVGCASPGRSSDVAAPGDVRIVVHRSGGFAGVEDTMTVDGDGRWTWTSKRGSPRSGRLTEDQRSRLRVLVGDRRLEDEAGRVPGATTCRDAFVYVLSVGQSRVGYTDCASDPQRPEAAAAIVDLLMDAAYAGG
jgi:hypothetical protein